MTNKHALPPLPDYFDDFMDRSKAEIQDYARAAVELDRKQRFLKERAQLEQEWAALKDMQAQYEAGRQRIEELEAELQELQRQWAEHDTLGCPTAKTGIYAIELDQQGRGEPVWTKTSDRMPEYYQEVYARHRDGNVRIARLSKGDGGYWQLATFLADTKRPGSAWPLNDVEAWAAIATPQPAEPVSLHPDDAAVDAFAAEMKAKLAKKRADGRAGWQECTSEYLSGLLREHVEKGDPLDVANLAMMLHQTGQRIVPTKPVKVPSDLAKRLRIKAGMITMGEKIAWGSDVELMLQAAQALESYGQPAQPSVPEPLKYGGMWKDHYVTGWNDCRAAMLIPNPPEIPDNSPTPAEEEAWRQMEAAQARADRIFNAAKK